VDERVKAFCVDFNWDLAKRFASPGLYAHADPEAHLAWYRELGANTIQSFCVSHNGYAWYASGVAPRTPGMRGDFLGELSRLARGAGMRMMGYFSPGGNLHWSVKHPDLSHPNTNWMHVPFTSAYIDCVCASIADALARVDIDGFMIDGLWCVTPVWMPCERDAYQELYGRPFPGTARFGADEILDFKRRAVQRFWARIRDTARGQKRDCILWLSCNDLRSPVWTGTTVFKEIDWLMNESPDAQALKEAAAAAGEKTMLVQNLCGWGARHDAAGLAAALASSDIGLYGFAQPRADTTLPPDLEDYEGADPAGLPDIGNARNYTAMRGIYGGGPGSAAKRL
jgi:hypothetical protein